MISEDERRHVGKQRRDRDRIIDSLRAWSPYVAALFVSGTIWGIYQFRVTELEKRMIKQSAFQEAAGKEIQQNRTDIAILKNDIRYLTQNIAEIKANTERLLDRMPVPAKIK